MRATTSASNLHRRVRCPGSHYAEHGLPDTDSDASAEGTLLHAAIPDEDRFATLKPAHQDLVERVRGIYAEVIERTVAAFAIQADEPFEEGDERDLTLRAGIRPILPGHCDRWRWYPGLKLLVIADAKFGCIEVTPAPLNLQLRGYATAGAQEWGAETVIVAVAQPRAFMTEGAEQLTIARYDKADLELAEAQIIAWEKAWMDKDARRVASEDACRYCKAKLLCDTRNARLQAVKITESAMGIADLADDVFLSMFEAVRMATKEDFQEAVKGEARTRAMEGRLPGYKLKPNAARRSINDQVQASMILRSALDFDDTEVAAASKVTIGEVESVLRKKTKVKAKDAKESVNAALAPVIELSTPEPSITPVSEHDAAKSI